MKKNRLMAFILFVTMLMSIAPMVQMTAAAADLIPTTVHFEENFQSQQAGALPGSYAPMVGSVAAVSGANVVVEDTNNVLHLPNSGRYTMNLANTALANDFVFDFDMKIGTNKVEGYSGFMALTDATGSANALRVVTRGTYIGVSGNSEIDLMEQNYTDKWYSFRAVIKMTAATKTIDWYSAPRGQALIHRGTAAMDSASLTSVGRINIYYNTDCYYDNMKIYEYKEPAFEGTVIDHNYDDWALDTKLSSNDSGYLTSYDGKVEAYNGGNAVHLTNRVIYDIPAAKQPSGVVVTEADFTVVATGTQGAYDAMFGVYNGAGIVVHQYDNRFDVCVLDSNGYYGTRHNLGVTVTTGNTYKLGLVLDFNTGVYKAFVNGELAYTSEANEIPASMGKITRVSICTDKSASNFDYWMDNFKMYTAEGEPIWNCSVLEGEAAATLVNKSGKEVNATLIAASYENNKLNNFDVLTLENWIGEETIKLEKLGDVTGKTVKLFAFNKLTDLLPLADVKTAGVSVACEE